MTVTSTWRLRSLVENMMVSSSCDETKYRLLSAAFCEALDSLEFAKDQGRQVLRNVTRFVLERMPLHYPDLRVLQHITSRGPTVHYEAVLDAITTFPDEHPDDPSALPLCCHLILSGDFSALPQKFIPIPVLFSLLGMMWRHEQDATVQRAALGFIVRRQYSHDGSGCPDRFARIFCRNGGFNIYTQAMRVHPGDLEIQLQAMTAIRTFPTDVYNEELFEGFDNNFGCEPVLLAMRNYPVNAQLQKIAIEVLGLSFSANAKADEDGSPEQDEMFLQSVVDALRHHPADLTVQEAALDLWALIVEEHSACRVPGGCEPIGLLIHALQSHCTTNVLQAVVAVLSRLFSADAPRTCQSIIKLAGGIPALLRGLRLAADNAQFFRHRDKICVFIGELLSKNCTENQRSIVSTIAGVEGSIALLCHSIVRADPSALALREYGSPYSRNSLILRCLARSSTPDGKHPLHYIVSAEAHSQPYVIHQLPMLRCLLKEYPEACSLPTKTGKLPLHLAIESKAALQVVNALLEASVEAALIYDSQACLPLHVAIKGKAKFGIISALIEAAPAAGKEICRRSGGLPPTLMAAAADGDLSTIFLLLRLEPAVLLGKRVVAIERDTEKLLCKRRSDSGLHLRRFKRPCTGK